MSQNPPNFKQKAPKDIMSDYLEDTLEDSDRNWTIVKDSGGFWKNLKVFGRF